MGVSFSFFFVYFLYSLTLTGTGEERKKWETRRTDNLGGFSRKGPEGFILFSKSLGRRTTMPSYEMDGNGMGILLLLDKKNPRWQNSAHLESVIFFSTCITQYRALRRITETRSFQNEAASVTFARHGCLPPPPPLSSSFSSSCGTERSGSFRPLKREGVKEADKAARRGAFWFCSKPKPVRARFLRMHSPMTPRGPPGPSLVAPCKTASRKLAVNGPPSRSSKRSGFRVTVFFLRRPG
ncbi:hypothetical protein LZ31DRAFT_149279 [Colletotrichum somersetense]|nr:hypothetical protein LZ31DRAFT_149279 [Colletotrichum somersetense]